MRVDDIDATARIDRDAAEFVEPLLAKSRAFELIIVRAEGLALFVLSSGSRRGKCIREIESLIGNQNQPVRRDGDIDDLSTEYSMSEFSQTRFGFNIPNVHP